MRSQTRRSSMSESLQKLELNEEEKEHAKKDMEEMLNYIDN